MVGIIPLGSPAPGSLQLFTILQNVCDPESKRAGVRAIR